MSIITHNARTAHGGGFAFFFHRTVEAIVRRRAERRAAEHLMQLDDRLLRDVGLTRGDVADLYHG